MLAALPLALAVMSAAAGATPLGVLAVPSQDRSDLASALLLLALPAADCLSNTDAAAPPSLSGCRTCSSSIDCSLSAWFCAAT